MKVRLFAAAATIGLASVAWTTSAAADNPHGTPPGQQKADASATVNASAHTNPSAHANGKAEGQAKTSGHAHAAVKTQAQPTVSAGVAPSSATGKNTLEAATSTKTKLYGNGTTAGQIALQSGYAGLLHGPGNSQPHKIVCGAHEIDVHALKAHGGAAACASPSASTAETSSVTPAQANVAASAAAQAAGNSGVLSAQASTPAKTNAPAKTNKHAGGVLSAKAALAATAKKPLRLVATVRHGNLPFTGFGLWVPMALGLGLIGTGLAMRRKGNSLT